MNLFDLLGHAGWVSELDGPTGSCGLGRWTLRPYLVVRARLPDWVTWTRSPY
jgi:hypothetical protein